VGVYTPQSNPLFPPPHAAAAAAAAAAVETSSKMKKFSISKHEKILSDTKSTFQLFQDLIKDIQDPYDNRTTWTNPNPQIDQGLYIYTPGLFVG
jgi:hypothetical protein